MKTEQKASELIVDRMYVIRIQTVAHFCRVEKKIGTKMVQFVPHPCSHFENWPMTLSTDRLFILRMVKTVPLLSSVVVMVFVPDGIVQYKKEQESVSENDRHRMNEKKTQREFRVKKRIKWNGWWTKYVHVFCVGGLNELLLLDCHTHANNSKVSSACFALSCVAQIYTNI